MKRWQKVFFILIFIFVVMQFFRPQKNQAAQISANDISRHYYVSDTVQTILRKACYDCHSNNSKYPWYFYMQPVGWWLNSHIQSGKAHLNFSEFASYPISKQYKRLDNIIDEVKQGDMPMPVYTYEHKDARLTKEEKEALYNWCNAIRNSIKSKYPADSLISSQTKKKM